MFERLTVPDHVLAISFGGKITAEQVAGYRDELEGMLKSRNRISICCDFTGLSDMSGDALVEGLKADFELLSHIGRLGRCAVISDKEWPRAVIGLAAPMFPTFEMKAFTPDQGEAAMIWAAELPTKPKATTPAIGFLPTSKDDVLAFEINGVISSEEIPGVIDEVNAFLDRHEKVRLLGRIKRLGGFDPAIFMQGGLLSMKLAAIQKVERYAIVGAPGWMNEAIEALNPAFADIDMRTFPADREADAWAWLEAQPQAA